MPPKGRDFNLEMIKLLRKPADASIDPGVRIALNYLQRQVDLLRRRLSPDNSNSDEYGNPGQAPPPILIVSLTNKSGAARNLGEVVTLSAANENAFTVTATANDEGVIGVVASDSPDGVTDAVLVDAAGRVCVGGITPCLVQSPVNVGDALVSDTTTGYARKALTGFDVGIFGFACEELLASAGLIEALIEIDNRFKNFPDAQPYFNNIVYDLDGSVTGFSGYLLSMTVSRDSAAARWIEHSVFFYNASGLLSSETLSQFAVDGTTGLSSWKYAIEYSSDRVSRIVKTLEAGL